MQDNPDRELLNRLQAADGQAFDALVAAYQEKVVNTCYRFVHSLADAEDVAQDVFMEIYLSLEQFRGQSRLSTWIYRIAVTKSLDFIRKARRKKRLGNLKRFMGFSGDDPDPQLNIAAPATNPHDDLERSERAAHLHQALNTLPENQRTAIILSKFEGLSYAEIAAVMDSTVSAIEALIHRAKANIHKKLFRYYEENLR